MKITKKLLAMVLSIVMLCCLAPAMVFAAAVNLDDLLGEWVGVTTVADTSGQVISRDATLRIYKEGAGYKGLFETYSRNAGRNVSFAYTLTARPDGTILASDPVWVVAGAHNDTLNDGVIVFTYDGTFLRDGSERYYERMSPPPAPPAPLSSVSVSDIIQFGGHSWQVLDVQDGKALIITQNLINGRRYHNQIADVTWEQSDLRRWLNDGFYNSIPTDERARIAETTVVNSGNPWYGTRGGNDTQDKIFLLSIEEVVRYFGDSGRLQNIPASASGKQVLSDEYDSARIANQPDSRVAGNWYLRTPGSSLRTAVYVNMQGRFRVIGGSVSSHGDNNNAHIRPALWVNIDATGATPPPPLFGDIATITADQLAQLTLVNERGLMMGSGGRFNPFDRITNMQFITVMSRMANSGIADGNPWYQPHLDWAAGIGISGFDRDAFLTRDNMALWFYKYVLSTGITPEIVRDDTPAFTDIGGLSADYQEAILAMYEWGITVGTTAGTVFGLGNAERIAIAVIIGRFVSRNMP
jgi:hypothetical protein